MTTVAVLGGGFTGAVFAVHLLRAVRAPVEIVVVEPREVLGGGVAYGSAAPEHRINVPSDKMSALRDDPMHLTRWVRAQGLFERDAFSVTAEGHHYMRRSDFGRYVAELVDATVRAAPAGCTLRHVRARAINVTRREHGHRVALDSGAFVDAAAVVVTASHEAPAFPWPVDAAAAAHPGLVRDPWTQLPGLAVETMDEATTVVVAGTGLTMSDAVVSLQRRGFRGQVLAISRRALLPRGHGAFVDGFDLLQGAPLPDTARTLLRRVREAVARAGDWRPALDATRTALPALWQALPLAERRRALRRLRPFWDVHRFRTAPQVDALLHREQARGALRVVRGRIRAIAAGADGALVVRWQPPDGPPRDIACAAFVNCTGPTSDLRQTPNVLIRALIAGGLAMPDAVGIGLDCDGDGRLRRSDGTLADHLCVAGPLARAFLAEVTGVPEASAHARHVADRLAADPTLFPTLADSESPGP